MEGAPVVAVVQVEQRRQVVRPQPIGPDDAIEGLMEGVSGLV